MVAAIAREADRMAAAIISDEDLKSELHVVHQEMERGLNSPFQALEHHLSAQAFSNMGYRIPTIGYSDTVLHVHAENLKDFRKKFYVPNNSVVTCVGDFEPKHVLDMVAEYFGPIEPRPVAEAHVAEPPQAGMKRFKLHQGKYAILGMAYKAPAGLTRNAMALEVMAQIFEHPESSFKTGTRQGLYHSTMFSFERMREGHLFQIFAPMTTHTEKACVRAEKYIRDALHSFEFTAASLERAKNGLRNRWAQEKASSMNLSSALTEAVGRGDVFDVVNKYDVLNSINLQDLHRSTQYFSKDRLTVGMVLPGTASGAVANPPVKHAYPGWEDPQPAARLSLADKARTERGLYMLYPSDRIHLRVFAPLSASHAKKLVLSKLCTQGARVRETMHLTRAEVADFVDSRSIQRHVEVLPNGLLYHVSLPCAKAKESLEVIMAEIRSPLNESSTLQELKYQLGAETLGETDNVNALCKAKFLQALYTADSTPYMKDFGKISSDIHSLRASDMHLDLGGTYVTCLAPKREHLRLARAFEFDGDVPPFRATARPSSRVSLNLPGKSSTTVMYGCVVDLSPRDEAWEALRLGISVLGQSFSSRLMSVVREQLGLTYGISATLIPSGEGGIFQVQGTFATEKAQEGVARTLEVVDGWARGVEEAELETHKRMRAGSLVVGFDSASTLCDYVHGVNTTGREFMTLDEMRGSISGITLGQVNEAIQTYVKLPSCSLVQVG